MIVSTATVSLPVTTFTAAILALLVFGLAVYTMAQRVVHDQSWGDGGDPTMRLAIRAHGNLVEYAPIFVILMALLELRGADPTWLAVMASVFVFARVVYVAYSLVAQKLPLRILGFWGSAAPIAAGGVWLLMA